MIYQITLKDIPGILRRRKLMLVTSFILIAIISTIGAYVLPEKYESYTTILLQKDVVLQDLVGLTPGLVDRLTTFNEIIYSRSAILVVLDSLGVPSVSKNEEKTVDPIVLMRKKISTSQRGSDSFRITVTDSDPVKAQRAATVLAKLYIQMSLKANQQQNEDAVKFFERKVEEYRQLFETRQREFVSVRQGRLTTLPQSEPAFNSQLDQVEVDLDDVERVLGQQERTKTLIQSYLDNIDNPGTISQIASLETQGAVLYITELKSLSVKYNELISRYTPRYPEVQMVRQQLVNMLKKSTEALQADIDQSRTRKRRIENKRNAVLSSLNKSITFNELSGERESNYKMIKDLYEEMKLKLEQARVTRDLGERAESKYVILDPAQVPTKPTKPNRVMIIGGGFGLGLMIGLAAMFLGEMLDPTIRHRRDIEVFQKPIVAYLP